MTSVGNDLRVRLAAFEWLKDQVQIHDDVLPRSILAQGFTFQGQRVPLVGPQGIFKPAVCPEIPLTITTTVRGPYRDHFGIDGLLRYSYRGKDPQHRENVGLVQAMQKRIPLVYFHGIAPGRYLAAWPVYIQGADPRRLLFTVALDDSDYASVSLSETLGTEAEAAKEGRARREYITGTFRRRLHQQAFRERVLKAYRSQCALCRLRHEKLLDAAHIIADGEPGGDPVVQNGLALCKLHHAAFDKFFLAIRPDYIIEVRKDILEEEDGPMLVHGLKEMHEERLHLPRSHSAYPDPARLQERYERFRSLA
jgi:putative restriction endonuclease